MFFNNTNGISLLALTEKHPCLFEVCDQRVLTVGSKASVADPGFDLGGRGLCQRGGGVRQSMKVLTVEVWVIFSMFWPYFY